VSPPFFDEFDIDPSVLPLYHSRSDSSVIKNSLGRKKRNIVTAEIYLSSNTWKHALLGPGGAFYCQTIPVEKDFQKQFNSAYKVKSYSSELNNAYFVYNPSASPQLELYQEERHEELRNVRDYNSVDKAFYSYYTELPKGKLYDSILNLSKSIVEGKALPVDKVLAIRDFFLQRGEDGKRIFRYTLKPGLTTDPNIPNASMLGNFLFKTHAGYCTYYAGASLLMLRALGIPARFTTGFATVNRSDKNKGWYWFYASQAHAWTQVYFPGYGWMDFDMTIGNEEQQSAPKPDGTPPLPPPQPWLVINGVAESAADLTRKRVDVTFNNIIYFNDLYPLKQTFTRTIDASVCKVVYDKRDTTLACILPGDSIVVVSYMDEAKKIPVPRRGVKIEKQVEDFPKPIVADEIHIKPREKAKPEETKNNHPKKQEEKGLTLEEILWIAAKSVGGVVLFIFLLPVLILLYLMVRRMMAGNPKSKADTIYREALYRFHMAGLERGGETPLEYANLKTDPILMAGFSEFMNVYLRLKYGKGTLISGDEETINRFARTLGPSIRKGIGLMKTILNYFNILLASRYFMKPLAPEQENQTQSL
ncbi:MAG TPA: transglutaminase domain-containing protein, partial [Cyclobacteriaceae bacterium]|nr:transglutaminase domain-containing protein [Cyclobacteriaceae bacterium]